MTRLHFFLSSAALLLAGAALSVLVPHNSVTQVQTGNGPLRLTARPAFGQVPAGGGTIDVQLDLEALAGESVPDVRPVRLALVLDRSGSMHGEKLQRAKEAARSLVGLLTAQDELALVSFSSDVRELPLLRADAEGKVRMLAFIEDVRDDGGTNVSAALARARALMGERGGRVVLVSDGQPTEGETDPNALASQCETMHGGGVTVTALGVGNDYNGVLMQHLAEMGGGFYGYLSEASMLSEVLGHELNQARSAVAGRVVLDVQPAPGVTVVGVAGRHASSWNPRLSMPDLVPGAHHQVFVRLSVPASWGATQPLFDTHLQWVQPGTAEVQATMLSLALPTTASSSEQASSRVVAVEAAAVRAFGSVALQQAALAFEQGDRAHAFELMGNVRQMFGASADALAGDIADLDQTQARWKVAPADAARGESLQLTRKTMRNFGENNSY